jgi:hypothetical protein
LISDLEQVSESFGNQQSYPLAFALEECVGGNGGAHSDGLDRFKI